MKKLIIMVICALVYTPIAFPEESHQYDGTWKIKMITAKGNTRKGLLEISSQGGYLGYRAHKCER